MPEKNCSTCKESKPLSEFSKHKSTPDGYRYECKSCDKIYKDAYYRTREGMITRIYGSQIRSSKKRNHQTPDYTKVELIKWVLSQANFDSLFKAWEISGYSKTLIPSTDRLDDYKPYTLDNIQVTTWIKNRSKSHSDRKNGVNNKNSKPVIQIAKDGEFIAEYYSIRQASRDTEINQSDISQCCLGKLNSSGGFYWKHA